MTDAEIVKHTMAVYVAESGFSLPHWVRYISWFLVWSSVASASFFCTLYSQSWGKAKADEWLQTFFLSAVQEVFVMDPFKVSPVRNCINRLHELYPLCLSQYKVLKIKTHLERFRTQTVALDHSARGCCSLQHF